MSRPASATTETRKLAAIMFTDMVGFSRLMHEDEEKGLRLMDDGNEVIAQAVAEHSGSVLKKMGDAVLADFSSAASAVTCAVQIQTRLRDYNEGKPPADQVVLRIGIHLGDMVIRGQDLFGDGINVAARLEPLSEPGGICLSDAVYRAIGANATVKPILVGEVELKNIVERQVIYRIPSFYGGSVVDPPMTAHRRSSLEFGAVDRIEELPPPTRGPLPMAFAGVVLGFVSVVLGFYFGAVINPPYRIWEWELLEPEAIVGALLERANPAHVAVWESLDRETREAITASEADETDRRTAPRTIRRLRVGLNELIAGARPVLDEALATELAGDLPSLGEDSRRLNRSLLEATFPGSIQRYVGEPTSRRLITGIFATLWSTPLQFVLFAIAFGTLSALMTVYFASLKTLRIFFKDIRDVDNLLDYYIRDLGFRAPVKQGDGLVFRATWWTFAVYSILRLQARVSGNTVVLTGPTPMMRRLKKRMLLFAEGASA